MPPQTDGISTQDILLIIGAVGSLLSAILIPGILQIIKAVKANTSTLNAVHKLTNSNHTTSLQLVADSALKTAQTTGESEDVKLYESAHKALVRAETATQELNEQTDDSTKSK